MQFLRAELRGPGQPCSLQSNGSIALYSRGSKVCGHPWQPPPIIWPVCPRTLLPRLYMPLGIRYLTPFRIRSWYARIFYQPLLFFICQFLCLAYLPLPIKHAIQVTTTSRVLIQLQPLYMKAIRRFACMAGLFINCFWGNLFPMQRESFCARDF